MAYAGSQASPPNASALERVLADLDFARLSSPSIGLIRDVVDPWRCPASLLPWLAWSMSVDLWDEAWSEVRKRQAIADNAAQQRRKGTRAAVEAALQLLERVFDITEWWETYPAGRRGTFSAFVELGETDSLKDLRTAARRLVAASKPKSRLAFIQVGPRVTGALGIAGGMALRSNVAVEPLAVDMPAVAGPLFFLAAGRTAGRLTIQPKA